MGFASLWHMRRKRSGSRGLCLPATFRPQGLVALSTAYSLARLAGLVSCRQRLWDSPFGAFSSSKVARALRPTHDPLAVADKTPPTRTEIHAGCEPCKLGYRVLPSASPSRPSGCLARSAAGGSLGFRPFQGFHLFVLAGISARLLSRAFRSTSVAQRRPRVRRRVSIDERVSSAVFGRTPLVGFPRLNVPGTRPRSRPGLCVHLASYRTLPCDLHPLLGSAPACRSCQGR